MPAPAWENLDDFLDPADFATQAVVQPTEGAARTINGIFDDPYMNAQLGEFDMDTRQPRLTCKASDLVGIGRGASATIAGKSYDILTEPQSTGDGMAVLALSEA